MTGHLRQADRKRLGAVYTPRPIVDMILDGAGLANAEQLSNAEICDPACGDGAFLTAAAERVLRLLPKDEALRTLRRLAGFDIDVEAVERCRARLDEALHGRYPGARMDWRVRVCNAFDRAELEREWGRFTHAVGNPPYIRVQRLEEEGRAAVAGQWKTARGAYDSYLAFFELGLELLREGGTLGYIAPSSWLRSRAGRGLRTLLTLSHTVTRIVDFNDRQVFDKVSTYTAIVFIQKGGSTRQIPVERVGGGEEAFIETDESDPFGAWTALTDAERRRMEALQRRGPQLGEIADIHVGLQTLADDVFIVPAEESLQAPRGSKGLEGWILRPIVKASVMKEGVDPVRRVAVYPYDRHGELLPEEVVAERAPSVYRWLTLNKERLLARDKGKTDPRRWYAYGRNVSIRSSFGEKILTAAMNREPNFQLCADPGAAFYAGYCVKPRTDADTGRLLESLNSDDMDFFVRRIAQPYQSGWVSYAKSFIRRYPVPWDVVKS